MDNFCINVFDWFTIFTRVNMIGLICRFLCDAVFLEEKHVINLYCWYIIESKHGRL